MEQTRQFVILGLGLLVLIALMFWPQFQAKRRRQQQMEQLRVGDEVVTVGGIMGTLAAINRDENWAAIEVSPGIRLRVLLDAIGRVQARASVEETEQGQEEDAQP